MARARVRNATPSTCACAYYRVYMISPGVHDLGHKIATCTECCHAYTLLPCVRRLATCQVVTQGRYVLTNVSRSQVGLATALERAAGQGSPASAEALAALLHFDDWPEWRARAEGDAAAEAAAAECMPTGVTLAHGLLSPAPGIPAGAAGAASCLLVLHSLLETALRAAAVWRPAGGGTPLCPKNPADAAASPLENWEARDWDAPDGEALAGEGVAGAGNPGESGASVAFAKEDGGEGARALLGVAAWLAWDAHFTAVRDQTRTNKILLLCLILRVLLCQ
eukprot:820432-Prorocentrum_minimum.AAC.3